MAAGALADILRGRRLLLIAAAPAEAAAVRSATGVAGGGSGAWEIEAVGPEMDLVVTGVGKANAAAGLARVFDASRHGAVLNIGVAGALPGSGLGLGRTVAATASVYADEGMQAPEGFTDCAGLGFPLGPFAGSSIPTHPALLAVLRPLADAWGPVATVSTCSGTDALAALVASRTGAVAEAMEGAAVAHVAARLGVPGAEFRAISNTTGDRGLQEWDLGGALEALAGVIGRLSGRG